MGKVVTLPCLKISSMPDIQLDLSSIKVFNSRVHKVTCDLADTVYEQIITAPIKRLSILSNKGFLEFALNSAEYVKIMPASAFEINLMDETQNITIRLKSSKEDDTIQLVIFY